MPYGSLLARIQRFAFREFSRDPALAYSEFQTRLGEHFFGEKPRAESIEDLLDLQRIFTFESDWYWPSPLLDPPFFKARAQRLQWPAEKLVHYRKHLDRLREIAAKHRNSANLAEREMARLAQRVVDAWGDQSP